MGQGPDLSRHAVAVSLVSFILMLVALFLTADGWLRLVAICLAALFFTSPIINMLIDGESYDFRAFLTIAIHSMAAVGIGLVAVEAPQRWSFIWRSVIVIALIHAGAMGVSSFRDRTLQRLRVARQVSLTVYGNTQLSNSLEERGFAFYGLPVGMLVGLVLRALLDMDAKMGARAVAGCAIAAAAALLARELVRNARYMADPLWDPPSCPATKKRPNRASGRNGAMVTMGTNVADPQAAEGLVLDIACAVADVRQTFLWSSAYASAIVIALVGLLLNTIGVDVAIRFFLFVSLTFAMLAVQVPYIAGQAAAHRVLLAGREGLDRSEMKLKLQTHAPVLPKIPVLAALTATGTAGGMLFVVFAKIVEEVLSGR